MSFAGAINYLLATKRDDLSIRQLGLLMACLEGRQTVRGAAEKFRVCKPAITRAASRLAEDGLIERKPDPSDRRSVLLCITATGRRLANNFAGR